MPDFENYQSPYTWRYGSQEMRRIWSEVEKRRLWRKIWIALAEAQADFGLVTPDQLEDLRKHADQIDIQRSLQIEAEIHHDLMAELKAYSEQLTIGGGILHQGATSMDIEDNADALRIRAALTLVQNKLRQLILDLLEKIEAWADFPVMAFTHLQPAEPTTLGYRLAQFAQDLYSDWRFLEFTRSELKGKGFKGAVGTGAAYAELIGIENLASFEDRLSAILDLPFYPATTQTYPRKQEYWVVSALAGLGGSLYKFAFDLRFLQSPPVGELSEPFGRKQVGSSAMPFKRNPVNAEKIDSLARLLAQMPRLAWDNGAHSLLERTLDDSANRRTLLPESFLIVDEILNAANRIIKDLVVDKTAAEKNMEIYGPFAATERVLMALSKAGADRQEMHERLREHAMTAWESLRKGQPNPLTHLVSQDPQINAYLGDGSLEFLMDATGHVGFAPERARTLASIIRKELD
jgi:adenylosuccinate lyase